MRAVAITGKSEDFRDDLPPSVLHDAGMDTTNFVSVSLGTEPSSCGTSAWQDAGAAWGRHPADWAFLVEPYARDAVEAVFDLAAVGPGTRLCDVACGSGLALARGHRLGAMTSGLDAAEPLLEIARRRSPDSELVAGDMFHLPWPDASFDVVTSFNGIWGGCDAAVAEMARVARPGGLVAVTFWGPGHALDLREFFMVLGRSVREVKDELRGLASISAPGVAEAMFTGAGLEVVTRGSTAARMEWPDPEIAWRALRSLGPTQAALDALGEETLRPRALAAIESFRHPDGSYLLANELTHLVGRRPA